MMQTAITMYNAPSSVLCVTQFTNIEIYKPAYHLITCHARNQRATHAFNVLMFQCSYREKIIGNKSESYFLQQVDKDKIYRVCQKLPVI